MATQVRPGRPSLPPGDRDSHLVNTKVKPSVAIAARIAAAKDGRTLSGWVRWLIEREVGG